MREAKFDVSCVWKRGKRLAVEAAVPAKKKRLIPYWLQGHEVVCVACERTHAHAVDARCVACDESVCLTCRVHAEGDVHCPECEPRPRRKR